MTVAIDYLNKGTSSLNNGDFRGAIQSFTSCLKLNPNNVDAIFRRGVAYASIECISEALSDFSHGLVIDPNDYTILYNRAILYRSIGAYREAINDLTSIIELNIDNPYVYLERLQSFFAASKHSEAFKDCQILINRHAHETIAILHCGLSCANEGYLAEAIEIFSIVLRQQPTSVDALYNRAYAYQCLKKYYEAIRDYSEATRLDPTHYNSFLNRGACQSTLANYKAAISDYCEAIKINNTAPAAYHNLGIAYGSVGELERSIEQLSIAIDLQPDNHRIYWDRGLAYSHLNNYKAAIADFSKLLHADPHDVRSRAVRSDMYQELGDYKLAIADLTTILEVDKDVKHYVHRSMAYLKIKMYGDAISDLNSALNINQNDPVLHNLLGVVFDKSDKPEKAIKHFTSAINLDAKNGDYHINRGQCYALLDEHHKAIQDFSNAISLGKVDQEVYCRRGVSFSHLEEHESAIKDLSYSISLNPQFVDAHFFLGAVYYNTEDYPRSIECFETALQIDPSHGNSYLLLGIIRVEKMADIIKGHRDILKAVESADSKNILLYIFHIFDYLRTHCDTPMIVRRLIEREPNLATYTRVHNYIESSIIKLQPFEDFLSYRDRDSRSRNFHFTKSIINYYLGDEGSSFKILHNDIKETNSALSLAENYYYALTAASVGELYGISSIEILNISQNNDIPQNATELYYLAWHLWLLDEKEKAINIASNNISYLPSRYQLLLFTEDHTFIEDIKTIESNKSGQSGYLSDFKIVIHPDSDDYPESILEYAHYAELELAIRIINPNHSTKPIYEAIHMDFWQLSKELFNNYAQQLLNELYSENKLYLDKTEIHDLEKQLQIHEYVIEKFNSLKFRSKSIPSRLLEEELGIFIHAWVFDRELSYSKIRGYAAMYYEKIIRYFYLSGNLDFVAYLKLYFYSLRRSKIIQQTQLSPGSEETLLDAAKEFLKYLAIAAPPAFIQRHLDQSTVSLAGLLIASYMAKTSIHKIVILLNQKQYSSRSAKEDYEFFEAFFMENSFEVILEINSDDFKKSKSFIELEKYYNQYKYIIQKKNN